MIQTIQIKGFRCFDHINLDGLARVNVVTGANASGKTSFFEAIYLGANATATALQNIVTLRNPPLNVSTILSAISPGMPFPLAIGFQQQNTSNFEGLFRSFRASARSGSVEQIEISYKDNQEMRYDLRVHYDRSTNNNPIPVIGGTGASGTVFPLILERTQTFKGGSPTISRLPVTVNQTGQLQQPYSEPFGPSIYLFSATIDYAESDNVAWFSQLKEKGGADAVVEFITREFPFIKGIEVLAPNGVNALYATLADGSRRRLSSVSSGIHKIISILLGCSHIRKGIIIIDEIENGIFYSKYSAVWSVLYKFALETENQIFVSSHSLECLTALIPTLEENEHDFTLLRTEQVEEKFSIVHVAGKSMKSALKFGAEIRG
jgi:hypothetical protein